MNAIRPGSGDTQSGAAIDQAAADVLIALGEIIVAAQQHGQAQQKAVLALPSRFSVKELAKLRSLHEYGMTYKQIAESNGIDEDELRSMLGARPRKPRGKP